VARGGGISGGAFAFGNVIQTGKCRFVECRGFVKGKDGKSVEEPIGNPGFFGAVGNETAGEVGGEGNILFGVGEKWELWRISEFEFGRCLGRGRCGFRCLRCPGDQ
jgi:hypothetical protein